MNVYVLSLVPSVATAESACRTAGSFVHHLLFWFLAEAGAFSFLQHL
jgi:hypothetical protein